jgi:hypothetical protein
MQILYFGAKQESKVASVIKRYQSWSHRLILFTTSPFPELKEEIVFWNHG